MTAKKDFFENAANINIDSDLYPTVIPSVIQWNPTVLTVKTNFRYTNLRLQLTLKKSEWQNMLDST